MKVYILLVLGLSALASARRVRIRPVPSSAESLEAASQSGVEYYAEQEEASDEDQPRGRGAVLVSRQDNYGRANGQPRLNQQPKLRPTANKEPPVQTIRNYNKLNDDGSFTFGYEAADGSFKEETRGTDCVVRGKYGYIDPDGNKREFTYVSGNPCDPNAVEDEEEEPGPIGSDENIPQNIPARRPQAKARPVTTTSRPRPTQTVFQQAYNSGDDGSNESNSGEENIPTYQTRAPVVVTQRPALRLPSFAQAQAAQQESPRATPRPKFLIANQPARAQSVSITPRPTQPPATTYRPQLIQVTSAPNAQTPKRPLLDLDEELKNFQLEHNVIGSSTPRPRDDDRPGPKPSGSPIYSSELVYDPSSGQYNTVLYQQLPQNQGDFNLRGRLQSFVPSSPYYQPRPPQPFAARPPPHQAFAAQPPPRPLAFSAQPQHQPQQPPQQAYFQQQQSSLLQQSQQLYASQQRKQQEQSKLSRFPQSLLAQEPQRFGSPPPQQRRPEHYGSLSLPSQPFYYVSPAGDRTSLSNGQIDAFLRGHSISI